MITSKEIRKHLKTGGIKLRNIRAIHLLRGYCGRTRTPLEIGRQLSYSWQGEEA